MRIIICGAGRVGLSIASHLSMQDNEITIVDSNAQLVKQITDTYDINGVVGHASQPDVLKKAGAENAEIIIAVTDCDEINMIACQVAHSIFGISKKIGRVRNKNYREVEWANLFSQNHLPIDNIISPEEDIAQSIFLRMSVPGTTNDISLMQDNIHIFGYIATKDNDLAGQRIEDIFMMQKNIRFSIPFILRDNKPVKLSDNFIIQEDDEVYFICAKCDLTALLTQFDDSDHERKGNVVICGGGVVGEAVCDIITQDVRFKKYNIVVVEQNVARARYLSAQFKNVLVLNGSALDEKILKEANVGHQSTFISVMNDNESNVLSAILAKKMGAFYAIALNNNTLYTQLLPDRLIDAIVNPGSVTISKILQNVHYGYIKSVQSVRDTGIDIIEAKVTADCYITNIPLYDINFGENIELIGLYDETKGNFIVPNEKIVIKSGFTVILMSRNKNIAEIEKLFSFPIKIF